MGKRAVRRARTPAGPRSAALDIDRDSGNLRKEDAAQIIAIIYAHTDGLNDKRLDLDLKRP